MEDPAVTICPVPGDGLHPAHGRG